MSANSATGSAAQSVKKWIIDSDVENQLRLGALRRSLSDRSLAHGSIELYFRCPNLTVIPLIAGVQGGEWSTLLCLVHVDLSGCPKLESIPDCTFGRCHYLVSVVFGEHSNVATLGRGAFGQCSTLRSITLPDKLKVIEDGTFLKCSALEPVVFNKELKTFDRCAFQ